MTTQPGVNSRSERSHYVRNPVPWIGGCSDVGQKHRTNQDAMCLMARPAPERVAILALSDGVSTAPGSELASLVATDACCARLSRGLLAGTAANISFVSAFADANQAVLDTRRTPQASACTLIAAIMQPGSISVGNIGDSRAYWIGDDGQCSLLSTDDSMAQARIMLGMSRQEAEQSNQAHSITKWLGRDAVNITPSVITLNPNTNGWLLLCSDGLWNYASSPREMYRLVCAAANRNPVPSDMAKLLVAWANQQGGRDNITVAIARYEA